MNYATFWQRFAAAWMDVFVLMPLFLIQVWLESHSRTAAVLLMIPMTAAYCAYMIYCHGRFGKTIGKHAIGIRVVKTTGEPIGWREAWLRSSVDVGLAVLGMVSSFVALAAISDAEYYGVGWMQRMTNLEVYRPAWLAWMGTVAQVWIWSELIVMLTNRKRRAIHDFIAGTVVTMEPCLSDETSPGTIQHPPIPS